MTATIGRSTDLPPAFRHEALLYAGDEAFVAAGTAFVRAGLQAGERVAVMVPGRKIELLRDALGADARAVAFADMAEVGRNPGRIISAWHRVFDQLGPGRTRARGIGEPIWPGRSPAELAEAQRHDSLLNVAFPDAAAWVLCPYDTAALPPEVIAEARRSHPLPDGWDAAAVLAGGLPELGRPDVEFAVSAGSLGALRRVVAGHASAFGLGHERASRFVMSVHEVAANSVRHGGGTGRVWLWRGAATITCEVRDHGHIAEPLVGHRPPTSGQTRGFGLWIAHQLCDLVQVRSSSAGTTVRLHMHRR